VGEPVDWRLFGEAFVTLFVIMDPPGTVPIFLSLSSAMPPGGRRKMARQAALVAISVAVQLIADAVRAFVEGG
jgi:multiple antibiotic resistance protein